MWWWALWRFVNPLSLSPQGGLALCPLPISPGIWLPYMQGQHCHRPPTEEPWCGASLRDAFWPPCSSTHLALKLRFHCPPLKFQLENRMQHIWCPMSTFLLAQRREKAKKPVWDAASASSYGLQSCEVASGPTRGHAAPCRSSPDRDCSADLWGRKATGKAGRNF